MSESQSSPRGPSIGNVCGRSPTWSSGHPASAPATAAPETSALLQPGDPGRGGIPEPDHSVTPDEEDAVADELERLRGLCTRLDGAEQLGAVDRDRGPPGELLGEIEIVLVEARGLPRAEGQDAEGLSPGRDRQQHQRSGADRFERGRIGPEPFEVGQVLGSDRREQHRLARVEHLGEYAGSGSLEREGGRNALEGRLEPRFVTDARDALEVVAGAHVDVARVGQPRHGDLGDPSRDLVAVERRGEQLARLGEQPQPVVGPLAVGDLDDQPADPDRLAIGRANGVVAREPVAALADVQGCVVSRLRMDDRLARLDHLPVERLERRGERRDHLGERSPDVRLGWEPVQGGERVVDADEAKLAIPEADPDRRRAEHGVELGVRLLGSLEEERVVDRKRSASRDLVRDLEVGGTEATPRLAGSERDRPEQAAARLERDDDVRERSERLVEGQMLLVHRGLLQLAGARVFDEIRLTCPEHLRNGVGVVGLRRVPAPELAEQLLALVAPVRDDHLPQRPVLVERIDDAVVRDARYEQPGQIRERRLVVERRGEQRARLGEEVEPRLGVALFGDVAEDVDHELDVALGRQDRRRADDRPAFVAARAQAVAEHCLVGGVGDERAPARELVDRELARRPRRGSRTARRAPRS